MRNRAAGIVGVVMFLLLVALFAFCIIANGTQCEELLMLKAKASDVPGLNLAELEQLSENEFLITYEVRQNKTLRALHVSHTVTLVGTNSDYYNILRYDMIDGSFFTKAAQRSESRHAVLNETAAFNIFGSTWISGMSVQIDGQNWIVVGVVQDNDGENANIYIPASILGGQPQSMMVLLDDGAVNETYAVSALKSLGIYDSNYDIINLSRLVYAFWERLFMAAFVLLLGMLAICAKHIVLWLDAWIRVNKDRLENIYLRELMSRYPNDFLKMAGGISSLLACGAGILALLVNILKTYLEWKQLPQLDAVMSGMDFADRVEALQTYIMIDSVLFITTLIVVAMFFISVWNIKTGDWKAAIQALKKLRLKAKYR